MSKPIEVKLRRLLLTTSSFLLFALSVPAEALRITRGPYLQSGSTTGMIVKWRTDSLSNAVVKYGTDATNLNLTATQNSSNTNHEVSINGLTPDTRYFYSVGSDTETLAGGNNDHFFTTSPEMGTTKSFRIWAVGDSGTANSSARSVKNAYLNFTGNRGTDLMLMLGDNAYNDGTDSEYQRAVFEMYPEILRNSVVWSTLGNHDGHTANSSNQSGPYYNIFSFPRNGEAGGIPSGTEAYYSFDYGNIHFIVLDSYDTNRGANGAMMNWLREDAAATDKEWLIAIWHHPPYSKGSHDSDSESQLIQMRQNALPILEENGIDLVLSGHSHSYERSFLIDGHYGNSGSFNSSMVVDGGDGKESGDGAYQKSGGLMPNDGAVYIVAGSSGKTSGGSLNHRAMFVSMSRLGSVVMDVEGTRLDARFLDDRGNTVDNFTLVKSTVTNPPTNLAPVANAGSNQTVIEGNNVTLDGSGSSDPDGTIAAYKWSQVAGPGPTVTLINDNTAAASFAAPEVTADTTLTFELIVTDNLGLTASDQVAITVNDTVTANLAPVANAGPDQTVNEGFTVFLVGSGSDPDGTIATYQWSQVAGPMGVFTTPTAAATAGFTAPEVTADTTLTFELIVTDNLGLTASDQVAITVQDSVIVGGADLVVNTLIPDATTAELGGTLNYIVSALNQGTTIAGSNFLRLSLSTDAVIDVNDLRLTFPSRSVPQLTAGASQSLTGAVQIPADIAPGAYFLGAIVDVTNSVAETNEANNTRGVAITVTSTMGNGPDLVVRSLSVSPNTVASGGTLNFIVSADNQGNAESTWNFVRLSLSTDPVIDLDDRRLTKPSLGVPVLRSNGSHETTGVVTIPADVIPGNYFLGAIVDPSDRVSETDESNNVSAGVPIAVTTPSDPE